MSTINLVEATAALHVALARDFYNTHPFMKKFADCLDTSCADKMIQLANRVGVYEKAKEQVSLRKFLIRDFSLHSTKTAALLGQEVQVVILASGVDPLALSLLHDSNGGVSKVFEVDTLDFSEKKELCSEVAPEISDKISYIQENILSANLLEKLTKNGFDSSAETLVIMEGISHYLPKENIKQILQSLQSGNAKREIILEFGTPYEGLDLETRKIAETAHNIIKKETGLEKMYQYPAAELELLFNELGGGSINTKRTAQSPYSAPRDGWLEVMHARI